MFFRFVSVEVRRTAALAMEKAMKTVILIFMAAALLFSTACNSNAPDPAGLANSAATNSNGAVEATPEPGNSGSTHDENAPTEVNEGTVIATVSDINFTVGEYLFFKSVIKMSILENHGLHPGTLEEDMFWNSEVAPGVTMAESTVQTVLDEMRDFKILSQFVRENGFITDDERMQVRGALAALADEMGGVDAFNEHIKENHGISRILFLDLFEQRLIKERFFENLVDAMVIPESEIRAEYEENIMLYEVVRVMQIFFIRDGEDGQRGAEESRALAEQILDRVDGGEDMRSLAFEYSEDPDVPLDGGLHVFGRFDGYLPEFTDWSFAASAGDTGIIETIHGFHVMRLENRFIEPYEHAAESIASFLRDVRIGEMLDEWFQQPRFQDFVVNEEILAEIPW